MNTRLLLVLLLAIAVAGVSTSSADTAANRQALSKISPWVMAQTASGNQTEFFVVLSDHADLSSAAELPTKEAKGRFVFDALITKAKETQGQLIESLE